jgi:hypothetical protein
MDRLVMMSEERRHLLIELAEVILDHAQFFQGQPHESPIYGMEIHARTQGGAQLVGRGTQPRIRQRRQRRRIGLAIGEDLQHAAGAGAQQIGDDTRELDVRFFEQGLQWLGSWTRLRVTWYLRRITVRHSRCSVSGTKLKVSS